jgi:uncharacterized membrane protein
VENFSFFILHWIHVYASIIWIGTLYFFNFFLTPFLAQARPEMRIDVFHRLVPLTLAGFNWSTLATLLTGWIIYVHQFTSFGSTVFFRWPYGLVISVGGILGTVMFLNGWFIMHPKQKLVIASATRVAQGGQPDPAAADHSRRVVLASRTNLLLSIPMIFLMVSAVHDSSLTTMRGVAPPLWFWLVILVTVGLVELNVFVGTEGPTKKPLETVKGAASVGAILLVLYYALIKSLIP